MRIDYRMKRYFLAIVGVFMLSWAFDILTDMTKWESIGTRFLIFGGTFCIVVAVLLEEKQ